MEVDNDNDLLSKIALGGPVQSEVWPDLRQDILTRLDKIAHESFPIPNLPPPPAHAHAPDGRLLSPLPSSSPLDPSQEANKENAPVERPPTSQPLEPGALPKQIVGMLTDITNHLQTFNSYPPHTIQRLAELILKPRAHYKALAAYLHAVDRVVQVTSGTDTYPLPPAIPDMSSMITNGDDSKDPAATVAWSNPTNSTVGSDEALGGALLTPIPWLSRRSPDSNGSDTAGAQIHSEGTETIEGPNGMGRIETVSVSVNGVPSTGHTRGVTQGELLRQEQRAGVVPVSQLARAHDAQPKGDRHPEEEGDEEEEEEEETPHARGPEEIGVNDTGPQVATTSYVGEGGLEVQGLDVEAAVGRKHEDGEHAGSAQADDGATPGEEDTAIKDAPSPSGTDGSGTKREADQELAGDAAKKLKEDADGAADSAKPAEEDADKGDAAKGDADEMETDK